MPPAVVDTVVPIVVAHRSLDLVALEPHAPMDNAVPGDNIDSLPVDVNSQPLDNRIAGQARIVDQVHIVDSIQVIKICKAKTKSIKFIVCFESCSPNELPVVVDDTANVVDSRSDNSDAVE